MRGSVCFVLIWTILWCGVYARDNLNSDYDESLTDLENVINMLESENFIVDIENKTILSQNEKEDKDTAVDEKEKNGCTDNNGDNTCNAKGEGWTCENDKTVESKYKCVCKSGYKISGEKCIEKNGCTDNNGDNTCNAKGVGWTCENDKTVESKYKCVCKSGYKISGEECIVKNKCDEENKCNIKSTTCEPKGTEDYICKCKPGFKYISGKTVEDNKDHCIRSCDPNPCHNGGKCVEDDKKDATCECPDDYSDGDNCTKPTWCLKNNPCQINENEKEKGVKCEFNSAMKTGFCTCEGGKIFNYKDKKCIGKPTCVDEKCTGNEVCNITSGECVCQEGYKKEDKSKECKKIKECKSDTCYDGAECLDTRKVGVVTCTCKDDFYYSKGSCVDGACLLTKKKCDKCPDSLDKKEDGSCEMKNCDKKCGRFGWCHKSGDEETCKCVTGAENDEEGKCVLKSEICHEGQLAKDKLRCECSGKFRLSSNKVTCERRMCADKDVQEECEKQNAVCFDNWKDKKGFSCKCQEGYSKEDGVCKDKCSLLQTKYECAMKDKLCFLNETKETVCRCPPGLYGGENSDCIGEYPANSTYIIDNLLVISEKYKKYSEFDVVTLAADIIQAMKSTFLNLEFAHLYSYKQLGEFVNCTIWLQFKTSSAQDYKRIKLQAVNLKSNAAFLYPGLFLRKAGIKNVKETNSELCSGLENDPFCGSTKCEGGKCNCPPGHKAIDSSLKKFKGQMFFRCEDINECMEGKHSCDITNSVCVNTIGGYYCKCLPGFKTKNGIKEEENQLSCLGVCESPNPCNNGECITHEKSRQADCSCPAGKSGSFCDHDDVNLAGANKKTVVVGAVLGSILGIIVLVTVAYILRKRKNSYSEDFTPCPRPENGAEMAERRPVRGVHNRAYQ